MNRVNRFLSILFLISLIFASVFVSYKQLVSYYWQFILVSEWSNSSLKLDMNILNSIDVDFPNLSNAALPLYAMKARYYAQEQKFDSAFKLFNKGIKHNPYMGVSENLISQIYYNQNNFDSSYKYSKIALEKLPNNYLHRAVFINSLFKLDSNNVAEKLFKSYLNENTRADWRNFMQIITEVEDTLLFDKYILKADSVLGTDSDLNQLKIRRKISNNKFAEADVITQLAKIDFDKGYYDSALKKYYKALKLNPYDFNIYDNIGLILFKEYDDSLKRSKQFLTKSIEINQKNGKSFYYLGIIEYSLGNLSKDSICRLFNISKENGFNEASNMLKGYGCK